MIENMQHIECVECGPDFVVGYPEGRLEGQMFAWYHMEAHMFENHDIGTGNKLIPQRIRDAKSSGKLRAR